MTTKKPKSLYSQQEVYISPWTILIGSFTFALIFFLIGTVWKYYITIGV